MSAFAVASAAAAGFFVNTNGIAKSLPFYIPKFNNLELPTYLPTDDKLSYFSNSVKYKAVIPSLLGQRTGKKSFQLKGRL